MKSFRLMLAATAVSLLATACATTTPSLPAASSGPMSYAAGTPEDTIRSVMQPRLTAGSVIDSVTKTPYSGLYEVRVGTDILYADAKAEFVFVGNIVDGKTQVNLTQARINDLLRIDFKDLPLGLAQKTVKGNGSRVVAVFADPNCAYCKRLEKELESVDNVTIYTFLFPVLGDDSVAKSRQIACAADRGAMWDEWMLSGKVPTGESSCKAAEQVDQTLAYGRKLKIDGTPTLFFADGFRVPGLIPADQLSQYMDAAASKQPHVATAAIGPQSVQ
jgi:thiol:disulfide interchange protein DsbC